MNTNTCIPIVPRNITVSKLVQYLVQSGGVKILFADDQFATVYVCDHVERDGSCKPQNVEIEVFTRHLKITPPQEVTNQIMASIEGACFSESDFEKLDHTGR